MEKLSTEESNILPRVTAALTPENASGENMGLPVEGSSGEIPLSQEKAISESLTRAEPQAEERQIPQASSEKNAFPPLVEFSSLASETSVKNEEDCNPSSLEGKQDRDQKAQEILDHREDSSFKEGVLQLSSSPSKDTSSQSSESDNISEQKEDFSFTSDESGAENLSPDSAASQKKSTEEKKADISPLLETNKEPSRSVEKKKAISSKKIDPKQSVEQKTDSSSTSEKNVEEKVITLPGITPSAEGKKSAKKKEDTSESGTKPVEAVPVPSESTSGQSKEFPSIEKEPQIEQAEAPSLPQNQVKMSFQPDQDKLLSRPPAGAGPSESEKPLPADEEKNVSEQPVAIPVPPEILGEQSVTTGQKSSKPEPAPSNQISTFTEKSEGETKIIELGVTPEQMAQKCPDTACGGYTVNFEDISVIQLIRFISQISGTNFIYTNDDVKNIKVTFVSDEPANTSDLMTALVQVLRMHSLSVLQEGKNVLIFKTDSLSKRAMVVTDENLLQGCNQAVITRVFRLYNLSPDKVSTIIKPFLSKDAVVEVLNETRHLIVSDINGNIQQVQELLAVIDTPNLAMDIAEYTVKNGSPEVIVNFAKDILNPLIQGNPFQMIPQTQSHKIFIVTTPYLIHKAIAILESLDTPEISEVTTISAPTELANNQIYVYKVRYRKGSEISAALHTIASSLQFTGTSNPELVSAIYSIQNVEMNNTLIIVGTPEVIDKVVQLITDLDTAPKQVYLEVLIIDTEMTNSLDFGVEWVALAREQDKLAFASGLLQASPSAPNSPLLGTPMPAVYAGAREAAATGTVPQPARGAQTGTATTASPGTGGDIPLDAGFGFGIVGNILRHNGFSFLTLGSLIKALEGETDTVIVLNPKILVQDMQEANLFVGSNIPYQTTNTIIRDTGSVTQNYQYEDVGVQLRVTPQVGPDNMVILQIDQSVSEVTSSATVLTPTTNKTLTSTRVHVPDGCFLVMSGHVRDNKIETKSGIPCLGSLPYIGSAFSRTQETRDKRNLIMFVQPHLITDPRKDGIELTNEEGYNYNWESHPSSMVECDTRRAPEMQSCPPPPPEEPLRKENLNLIGP